LAIQSSNTDLLGRSTLVTRWVALLVGHWTCDYTGRGFSTWLGTIA